MGRGKGERVWFKGKFFGMPFKILNSTKKSYDQVVEKSNDQEFDLDKKEDGWERRTQTESHYSSVWIQTNVLLWTFILKSWRLKVSGGFERVYPLYKGVEE